MDRRNAPVRSVLEIECFLKLTEVFRSFQTTVYMNGFKLLQLQLPGLGGIGISAFQKWNQCRDHNPFGNTDPALKERTLSALRRGRSPLSFH